MVFAVPAVLYPATAMGYFATDYGVCLTDVVQGLTAVRDFVTDVT